MPDRERLDYERIEFTEVYHSSTQGPDQPIQAVIRSEEERRKILPDIALPSIDFTTLQLIAVAPGDKPTSGYDVRITDVTYFTDRLRGRPSLTMVSYKDVEKGGLHDQMLRPIHVVSTRRLEGDVEFECNEVC